MMLTPETSFGGATLAPPPSLVAGKALFLDFDGTLTEIAPHPDEVSVIPGLGLLLAQVADRLDGRMAIISGRSLSQLEQHLGPLGIAVAGSHGGEFREAGAAEAIALAHPIAPDIVQQVSDLAEELGGLLVESKPYSVAIHYRDRPEARDRILDVTREIARNAGVALKSGKMVFELVMPGSDKGSAARRFMSLPAFADSLPLFAGDDMTDEDAFAVVTEFGGGGVLVGPMRETAALWRLDGVAQVHAWLGALVEENAL